jgi:hypothetical protein
VRAIDVHVHLPNGDWLDRCLGPYLEATERYFHAAVERRSTEDLAAYYESIDTVACLLAWDAETATGRPPLTNDEVAGIASRFPERFVPIASVDPHKGDAACAELERAVRTLGMQGLKVHPQLQAFRPDDAAFEPLWETAESLGIPVICHTGTSGVGAGAPGGQGIELDYARPIRLDAVAARHPRLRIVMAHFGWPWHLEAIAISLHKSNVFIDTSGWAPRFLPPELVREMKGRLRERVVFGSDYPFISPERCFAEIDALGIGDTSALLYGNAARLFGL